MNESIKFLLEKRDSPAGRKFEVRIAFWDSIALMIGVVALAYDTIPLLTLSALAHVVAGYVVAIDKLGWTRISSLIIAVFTAIVCGISYITRVYIHSIPYDLAFLYVEQELPYFIVKAVVISGLLGAVFSVPGFMDQVREYVDKKKTGNHSGISEN